MNKITLCMAYYENAGMLAVQYEALRSLPPEVKEYLQVIIVDDGTAVPGNGKNPQKAAWPEDIGIPLRIFAMDVDVPWNQDACRNLAVRHSETEWMLLTDIDHLVPETTWQSIIAADLSKNIAYRFARKKGPQLLKCNPHPNSWLITKPAFEAFGGYDERFAGYYGTVGDFRKRLEKKLKIKVLPHHLHVVTPEMVGDCMTVRYVRDRPEDPAIISRIAAQRKKDGNLPLGGSFPWHRVA